MINTAEQGGLPFHDFCVLNNTETAKFLFQLFPGFINVADESGNYPIHCLVLWSREEEDISELTQFLLQYDQGAVTKQNISGQLPLHLAIGSGRGMDIVKFLFDAYPEAIYIEWSGCTPLELAREMQVEGEVPLTEEIISYFEHQLEFVRQSEEYPTLRINGQLLIHRGLHDGELSLGAIKLMVKANPAIVNAADNRGDTPLIIALNCGKNDIAKYLITVDAECLSRSDSRGNFLLHHVCSAGNCDIVNFILETSDHGASARNSEGKLPIQLLLNDAGCNRNFIEYVSAIYSLLLANKVSHYSTVTNVHLLILFLYSF